MSLNKIRPRWLLFFHQDLGVAIHPAQIAWAENQAVKTDSPLVGLTAYRQDELDGQRNTIFIVAQFNKSHNERSKHYE